MMLPAYDYRRTRIQTPAKLHQGLDGFVYGLIGQYRRVPRRCRSYRTRAEAISDQAMAWRNRSDRRVKDRLEQLAERFRRVERELDAEVDEALSLLVEAAHRTLGLRPFMVQIWGAMALNDGYLIEMATGEGKSLTACLAAALAGWSGRPCHIVTVNDYLAARDEEEMRPFYAYCGLTVGSVTGPMEPRQRQEQYARGVVYTTSKELVADFLRDRILLGPYQNADRRLLRTVLQPGLRVFQGLVQRGIDTAIVDEADSLLIDEAVTPLIISRPQENRPLVDACATAYGVCQHLTSGIHYKVDLKYREIRLTKTGEDRIADLAADMPAMWQGASRREELVVQALNAREFYARDKQYVVQEGKVAIVDEFTGRLMANRTWRHGLHQSVEAKEGVEVSNPSETLARLSFQRFFRFFRKLAGMTGTAREAAGEFWHIYGLPVMAIPTNRPCVREVFPDRVFAAEEEKWRAVVEEIRELHASGRPVLVGTRSVQASEKLATLLTIGQLEFNLLNAVRHKEEARIVAAAGEAGRITIATNMAGRGTDIKLGRGVAELGGLHVIATERHESGRIDRQLFGRCARQGDKGSAQAYMSADDELLRRFMPEVLRRRLADAIRAGLPVTHLLAHQAVLQAQRAAQRLAFRQRRNVLKMDNWLEEALSFTGSSARF
jgi:preprotein translocase subunit SecA